MFYRFIGDVHGKFRQYEKIISDAKSPPSIQVGDLGIGFKRLIGEVVHYSSNPSFDKMTLYNARFIRGNHDNPEVCQRHACYIPDGTIIKNMMFIGGAFSIDRSLRTEGLDWWADEELSIEKLNRLVDVYEKEKPEVMVTHECPESVSNLLVSKKWDISSRTRQAFESMFYKHKPKLWIFGHWHVSFDYIMEGTRFICLDELEYKDIDIH